MVVIYTKYITLRNGKILHAEECGLDAFRFEVPEEKHKEYLRNQNKKDSN